MRHRNDVLFRAHTVWDNADHAETSSLHGNCYVNEMGLFETCLLRLIVTKVRAINLKRRNCVPAGI